MARSSIAVFRKTPKSGFDYTGPQLPLFRWKILPALLVTLFGFLLLAVDAIHFYEVMSRLVYERVVAGDITRAVIYFLVSLLMLIASLLCFFSSYLIMNGRLALGYQVAGIGVPICAIYFLVLLSLG